MNYLKKFIPLTITLALFFVLPIKGQTTDENHSLSFDGVNDYVATGIDYTDLIGASEVSISLSMKWLASDSDGGTSSQGLISNGSSIDGHQIELSIDSDNSQKLSLWWSDNSTAGSPNMQSSFLDFALINYGQWYNIKVVLNDNTVKWYIDDQLVETDDVLFTTLGYYQENGVPALHIGQANRVYDTFFNGLIDEVQISINGSETNLAHWNFNQGEGTTLTDLSGNENHGTINGATWSTDVLPVLGCTDPYADNYNADANIDDGSCSGYPDNGHFSLNFDGSGHISISEKNINGTFEEFSFSSWVNVNDFGNDYNPEYIFDVGRNADAQRIALGVNQDGFTGFINGVENNIFNVNADFSEQDQWVYVSMVWKGTDYAKIYINGDLIAETNDISTGTLTLNSGDPFKLGSRYTGGSHFLGKLSDVSIWGIALSESQIQSLMSTSSTSNEQGLLGYWKSDAGTGDILYDHSGNANHGTINGGTWSTDVQSLVVLIRTRRITMPMLM